jgi:hypothetical protein
MLSARATTLWRRMQPHLGTQPRTPAHTPLAKPARRRRRALRCLELSVRNAWSGKRAAATQQRRTPQRRRVPGHAVRRAQNL